MSIAAVSDAGQSLFAILQKVQQKQAASSTPSTSTIDGAATASSTMGSTAVGAPHHGHHKFGEFFKQLQGAVTSALQDTKNSPDVDVNKTIEDAIAGVLKNNPDALQALQARISRGGNAAPPDGSQPPKVQPGPQGAPGAGNERQAFEQLLQSFGIDASQFRNDFLNAIKNAQNGQVSAATALQSLPAGASLDVAA